MLSGMLVEGASGPLVSRIARTHREMAERATRLQGPPCPAVVLELGAAVLFHGALEECWLLALKPVLEPAAIAQLRAEHECLADDLRLLQGIRSANQQSPDLAPLSAALLERLRTHIARDERLLYRSALGPIPEGRDGSP